ncbi:MAG: hypothetical protein GF317_06685 [Candidatus Lokiarchaeota archaeon]|nr:hypothetical protein [Candidatus Lokiarchaeota archaeon]MBD3199400.1 hypothetical protein [Candidatus Lokiarchaeota archaeon]
MNRDKKKRLISYSLIIIILCFSSLNLISTLFQYQHNPEVQFKPSSESDIDINDLPLIDYEALNQSWYNSSIEMIIIAPEGEPDFENALEPLKEYKNQKGVKTIIITNYSEYEGVDTQEKIRNLIKSYYESDGIRWVLLAGDAQNNLIPIREVYNPDVRDAPGSNSEYSGWDDIYKPTDFYYADLDRDWDEDGDGKYGESSKYNENGIDEIDWTPEVYVGRLPADNSNELEIMVNKTLEYEMALNIGGWMNKMLLAGGVSDPVSSGDPEDEARLTEYIWQNYILSEMNFTNLIRTTSEFSPQTPPSPNTQDTLTQSNFINGVNDGYSTILFAGHGDPFTYTDKSGSGPYYSNGDANSASNYGMPSLVYAFACTTSSYDKNDNSIGENFIKRQNAGAIGYVGSIRVTWYVTNDIFLEILNRGNAKLFWKTFFEEKKYQPGMTLYNSKISYINSEYFQKYSSFEYEWERKNLLTYNLLGDPEIDIYTSIPQEIVNPFPNPLFEGQFVNVTIKTNDQELVPFPRVHLRTNDGGYRTVYGDIKGKVKFRLPVGIKNYNVTITGHNALKSNFNFTSLPDNEDPEFMKMWKFPEQPSVSNNILFHLEAIDRSSGIEGVYTYLTTDSFQNYEEYQFTNGFTENETDFIINLNKLDPGEYKFEFLIFTRDYANNTINSSWEVQVVINIPITNFVLLAAVFIIIGLTTVSSYIIILNVRNGTENLRKLTKEV